MDKDEALNLLRGGEEGVKKWNERRKAGEGIPDLFEADLGGTNLSGADLSGANLHGAFLIEAYLRGADLGEANLLRADLCRADVMGANLSGADLSGAILSRANLSGADLSGADLTAALSDYTAWVNLDLSGVKGLETIIHTGPSSVGVDTLEKSRGAIPEEFLRGCGVDPFLQKILHGTREVRKTAFYEWIKKDRSRVFDSCFISYCGEDDQFVDRLQKRLNKEGAEFWYAPLHAKWGEELEAQIDRAIVEKDRVIIVCSEASLKNSDWVRFELQRTLKEEDRRREEGREKWRMAFPILLDDYFLKGWTDHVQPRLERVLAGDFRNATKGQAFEERFGKLLEGLKRDAAY